MSSVVEQIKAKLNIVDVVSTYVKLEKAGSNFKARCPFHNERTPSFFVSPTRESYYCFGCNRGGDLISFVENIEGLDFLGALKILADKAGVRLEQHNYVADHQKEKFYDVLAAAKAFYAVELKKRSDVLAYLKKRGVQNETITTFGLGLAPDGWRGLHDFLLARGFPVAVMEQAGLVVASTQPGRQRYYDRFRNRIMFPLNDNLGRVVGFSGRILESNRQTAGSEEQEVAPAKYINSPQTLLYDKSKILYGYDQAKIAVRKEDYSVLVEGQFDLLMSHQTGMINTVAVSGTALTTHHLELLRRLSPNVVMAFDGDLAGISASRRAIELALGVGLEVKIAVLPPDTDPADLCVREPDKWRELCSGAKHVIDFSLEVIERKHTDRRELAKAIHHEVYPFIVKLVSKLDQAHFILKIAELTGLSEEVIRGDLKDFAAPPTQSASPAASPSVDTRPRREKIEARLFGLHFWLAPPLAGLAALPERPVWLGDFEKRFQELLAGDFNEREKHWLSKKNELVLEAELSWQDSDLAKIQSETEELLTNLGKEIFKAAFQTAMMKLAEAERQGNEALVAKYLKECQDISRQWLS